VIVFRMIGANGAAAAVLATALSGCATSPGACDPTREDFFNNSSCVASGAYRERQRGLESTLAAEQSRNRAFRSVVAELDAEKAVVRSELRSSQASYARADAAWRNLKDSLAPKSRSNPVLADRIDQIDLDMAARRQADLAGKRAERDALAQRVRLLEQEVAAGLYD